jgi:hypothetical protein
MSLRMHRVVWRPLLQLGDGQLYLVLLTHLVLLTKAGRMLHARP